MRVLRAFGRFFKNFMIIFSFIVNIVLIVVVLGLVLFIFDIKDNIVTPLVTGLHSSFVGLDESTIDWTIPVRDTIPVKFDLPLNQQTVVTLTHSVPLNVSATITLPGVGQLNNAQVYLNLPSGLQLPVQLDLTVPVDTQLPISMDVRAVIPLNQTQIHDPVNNLRLVFEPIIRALYNLPDNFGDAGQMVSQVMSGQHIDLLAENAYSRNPWPGFSRTAGLDYTLANEPVPQADRPVDTGIIVEGGIPALDQQLRPEVYEAGGPAAINAQAAQTLAQDVPSYNFNGSYGAQTASDVEMETSSSPNDLGILPTPTPGG
ncbi:MAG: hypothetical protein GC204_15400 [Chloroflexi bacterium]|nr:hypothetical protein [Chloroflexota bacterium]